MDAELEHIVGKQTKKFFTRKNFFVALLGCYLLPQLILAAFSSSQSNHLSMFLMGAAASASCLGGALFLLKGWERKMQHSVSILVRTKMQHLTGDSDIQQGHQLESYQKEIEQLKKYLEDVERGYEHQIDLLQSSTVKSKQYAEELGFDLEKKEEETRHLTLALEEMKRECDDQIEKQAHQLEDIQNALEHKESLLSEYHHTMTEQRMVIEKKQRYIAKLEGKVRDLMYEIRSLLQLEEAPPAGSFPIDMTDTDFQEISLSSDRQEEVSVYDLSLQLQRYIQKAQNFTGAGHLGYMNGKSPRFSEMSFESYAIDLRRLFDSFREETTGIIFVYSYQEDKFLFVNNFVKSLLGWSAEKFMKDFAQLMTKGFQDWQQALQKLPSLQEEQMAEVGLRAKSGEEILFQCFIGLVSSGPFEGHAIGILYPTFS